MSRAKLKLALDGLYEALQGLFPTDSLKLAVVSYFYPTNHVAEWAAVNKLAQVAIINPSSGAGTVADPNYVAQVDASVAAGLMVLGYCASGYGARPIIETLAEVARLKAHYPKIHGVFIDEMATGDTVINRSYYKQVFDKARALGLVVAVNPGTACPESFMALCDIVMDCETSAANYATKTFASWRRNYPRERFWHCLHGATAADMPGLVDRMRANHVGLAYLCETNAYNTVPTFFDALAAKVK